MERRSFFTRMLTGVGAASALAQAAPAVAPEPHPAALGLPIYMVDETRVERKTIYSSALLPPGTYIFYYPSPDDHFPPIMKVAESNDEMVAALVQSGNEAERAAERERCIKIIEDMVEKRPRQLGWPCTYDVPDRTPEEIANHDWVNHQLKVRWSVERLKAKSMVARIRAVTGEPHIELDEDDDIGIMDLGQVP